jgi:hypothetical protein
MDPNKIDDLLIKSKIFVKMPENFSLPQLNPVIIRTLENQGLVPIDDRLSFISSLTLDFMQGSLHPNYCKPTQLERLQSFIYRIFHLKENQLKRTPYLLAYHREITSLVQEVASRISINIEVKTNNSFVLNLTVYPTLYQKAFQGMINPIEIDYNYIAPKLLSHNTRLIEHISSSLMGTIIEEPHLIGIAGKPQIFISHSQKDEILKNFINYPISASNIKAIYEEYENLSQGEISRQKITFDISESIAIFVLFSENVNKLLFTRDWVSFESGFASALKRDVWVFELVGYRDESSLITPGITDYFPFVLNDENYLKYVKKIIQNYDLKYINREKLAGIPFECSNCHTQYNIHCPENLSYPINFLKCPVCNTSITTKIEPISK